MAEHDLPSAQVAISEPKGSSLDQSLLQKFRQGMQAKDVKAPDTEHAGASVDARERVWRVWVRFCYDMDPDRDPQEMIQEATFNEFAIFTRWYGASHPRCRRITAFEAMWGHLKMVYLWKVGHAIDSVLGRQVGVFVRTDLREEYDLIPGREIKPLIGASALYGVLYHLWNLDKHRYPCARDRLQFATLLLFLAYTGSRPGAIVESGAYRGSNEALLYKNVKVKLIKPARGQPLIVLEVTLLLMKGARNREIPKTLTLWENPDCPALCPVAHFLALAFADDAFHPVMMAEGFGPGKLHAIVPPEGRNEVEFYLRDDILNTPIFRGQQDTAEGKVVHPTRALEARAVNRWFNELGKRVGFEFPFSPYAFRREVGTQLAHQGVSDQQRNQIMGHARSETFLKHYLSTTVVVDVQAIFLGETLRSELFREAGKLCLRYDPNLPKKLTSEQRAAVYQQPAIMSAQAEVDLLKVEVKARYGTIVKAQGTKAGKEYEEKRKKLSNLKTKASREAFDLALRSFHKTADLDLVIRSLQGLEHRSIQVPRIRHALPERAWLADSLFRPSETATGFANVVRTMARLADLGEPKVVEDEAGTQPDSGEEERPGLIEDSAAGRFKRKRDTSGSNQPNADTDAATLQAARPSKTRRTTRKHVLLEGQLATEEQRPRKPPHREKPAPPGPLTLADIQALTTPLTCLYCVKKRGCHHTMKRPDYLRKHYAAHLKSFVPGSTCPVPACGTVLNTPEHFASHAVRDHGQNLGIRAPIMKRQQRPENWYGYRIFLC